MYLAGLNCNCDELAGLAAGYESLIPVASSLLSKGVKSAGSGGSAPSVQSSINTQVSPQISPIFIQQDKPQNSAINAGVSMTTPVTGAIPGFDASSGYLPSIPSYSQVTPGFDKRLLLIPVALIVAAFIFKKRKQLRFGNK